MDAVRFFFWEALKAVALAFIALACVKAIAGLSAPISREAESGAAPGSVGTVQGQAYLPLPAKFILYALVLLLVAAGARAIGNDVAAEIYFVASHDNLQHLQPVKAYENALAAVRFRSGQLRYWQMLSTSKLALRQYWSLLKDQQTLERLEGGHPDEQDAMRFAFAHLFLGQYEQAIALSSKLTQQNRSYAPAYVLLGTAYGAERRYTDAERSLLNVLQIYPTNEAAVEALAHLYFIMGNPARAVAVLNQTSRFPFDPEARRRFEQLTALYQAGQLPNRSDASSR